MIWKQVPSYPFLEASEEGYIRNVSTNQMYAGSIRNGYKVMYIEQNYRLAHSYEYMHRLICEAWYGQSELTVDHIDGNKLNNRPSNLRWISSGQNSRIANLGNKLSSESIAGRTLLQHGENHYNTKLTDKQVKEIKNKLLFCISPKSIAKEYGVGADTIYHIKNGSSWSHIK